MADTKEVFTIRPAVIERYDELGKRIKTLTGNDASKIEDAAKKLKISFGKARRIFTYAQRKPGEKLWDQNLTPKQIGAKLIQLRDSEQLTWDPEIWSYMLTTQDVARELYESAGGKDWSGRGGARSNGAGKAPAKKSPAKSPAKKSAAKRKPAAKKTSAAKRQTKKAATGGGPAGKRGN
jgi:hypothetical protein